MHPTEDEPSSPAADTADGDSDTVQPVDLTFFGRGDVQSDRHHPGPGQQMPEENVQQSHQNLQHEFRTCKIRLQSRNASECATLRTKRENFVDFVLQIPNDLGCCSSCAETSVSFLQPSHLEGSSVDPPAAPQPTETPQDLSIRRDVSSTSCTSQSDGQAVQELPAVNSSVQFNDNVGSNSEATFEPTGSESATRSVSVGTKIPDSAFAAVQLDSPQETKSETLRNLFAFLNIKIPDYTNFMDQFRECLDIDFTMPIFTLETGDSLPLMYQVKLDRNTNIYQAGECVKGTLLMCLIGNMPLISLTMRLTAICLARGIFEPEEALARVVFEQDEHVFHRGPNQTAFIPYGVTHHRFHFDLPKDAYGTYYDKMLSVFYCLHFEITDALSEEPKNLFGRMLEVLSKPHIDSNCSTKPMTATGSLKLSDKDKTLSGVVSVKAHLSSTVIYTSKPFDVQLTLTGTHGDSKPKITVFTVLKGERTMIDKSIDAIIHSCPMCGDTGRETRVVRKKKDTKLSLRMRIDDVMPTTGPPSQSRDVALESRFFLLVMAKDQHMDHSTAVISIPVSVINSSSVAEKTLPPCKPDVENDIRGIEPFSLDDAAELQKVGKLCRHSLQKRYPDSEAASSSHLVSAMERDYWFMYSPSWTQAVYDMFYDYTCLLDSVTATRQAGKHQGGNSKGSRRNDQNSRKAVKLDLSRISEKILKKSKYSTDTPEERICFAEYLGRMIQNVTEYRSLSVQLKVPADCINAESGLTDTTNAFSQKGQVSKRKIVVYALSQSPQTESTEETETFKQVNSAEMCQNDEEQMKTDVASNVIREEILATTDDAEQTYKYQSPGDESDVGAKNDDGASRYLAQAAKAIKTLPLPCVMDGSFSSEMCEELAFKVLQTHCRLCEACADVLMTDETECMEEIFETAEVIMPVNDSKSAEPISTQHPGEYGNVEKNPEHNTAAFTETPPLVITASRNFSGPEDPTTKGSGRAFQKSEIRVSLNENADIVGVSACVRVATGKYKGDGGKNITSTCDETQHGRTGEAPVETALVPENKRESLNSSASSSSYDFNLQDPSLSPTLQSGAKKRKPTIADRFAWKGTPDKLKTHKGHKNVQGEAGLLVDEKSTTSEHTAMGSNACPSHEAKFKALPSDPSGHIHDEASSNNDSSLNTEIHSGLGEDCIANESYYPSDQKNEVQNLNNETFLRGDFPVTQQKLEAEQGSLESTDVPLVVTEFRLRKEVERKLRRFFFHMATFVHEMLGNDMDMTPLGWHTGLVPGSSHDERHVSHEEAGSNGLQTAEPELDRNLVMERKNQGTVDEDHKLEAWATGIQETVLRKTKNRILPELTVNDRVQAISTVADLTTAGEKETKTPAQSPELKSEHDCTGISSDKCVSPSECQSETRPDWIPEQVAKLQHDSNGNIDNTTTEPVSLSTDGKSCDAHSERGSDNTYETAAEEEEEIVLPTTSINSLIGSGKTAPGVLTFSANNEDCVASDTCPINEVESSPTPTVPLPTDNEKDTCSTAKCSKFAVKPSSDKPSNDTQEIVKKSPVPPTDLQPVNGAKVPRKKESNSHQKSTAKGKGKDTSQVQNSTKSPSPSLRDKSEQSKMNTSSRANLSKETKISPETQAVNVEEPVGSSMNNPASVAQSEQQNQHSKKASKIIRSSENSPDSVAQTEQHNHHRHGKKACKIIGSSENNPDSVEQSEQHDQRGKKANKITNSPENDPDSLARSEQLDHHGKKASKMIRSSENNQDSVLQSKQQDQHGERANKITGSSEDNPDSVAQSEQQSQRGKKASKITNSSENNPDSVAQSEQHDQRGKKASKLTNSPEDDPDSLARSEHHDHHGKKASKIIGSSENNPVTATQSEHNDQHRHGKKASKMISSENTQDSVLQSKQQDQHGERANRITGLSEDNPDSLAQSEQLDHHGKKASKIIGSSENNPVTAAQPEHHDQHRHAKQTSKIIGSSKNNLDSVALPKQQGQHGKNASRITGSSKDTPDSVAQSEQQCQHGEKASKITGSSKDNPDSVAQSEQCQHGKKASKITGSSKDNPDSVAQTEQCQHGEKASKITGSSKNNPDSVVQTKQQGQHGKKTSKITGSLENSAVSVSRSEQRDQHARKTSKITGSSQNNPDCVAQSENFDHRGKNASKIIGSSENTPDSAAPTEKQDQRVKKAKKITSTPPSDILQKGDEWAKTLVVPQRLAKESEENTINCTKERFKAGDRCVKTNSPGAFILPQVYTSKSRNVTNLMVSESNTDTSSRQLSKAEIPIQATRTSLTPAVSVSVQKKAQGITSETASGLMPVDVSVNIERDNVTAVNSEDIPHQTTRRKRGRQFDEAECHKRNVLGANFAGSPENYLPYVIQTSPEYNRVADRVTDMDAIANEQFRNCDQNNPIKYENHVIYSNPEKENVHPSKKGKGRAKVTKSAADDVFNSKVTVYRNDQFATHNDVNNNVEYNEGKKLSKNKSTLPVRTKPIYGASESLHVETEDGMRGNGKKRGENLIQTIFKKLSREEMSRNARLLEELSSVKENASGVFTSVEQVETKLPVHENEMPTDQVKDSMDTNCFATLSSNMTVRRDTDKKYPIYPESHSDRSQNLIESYKRKQIIEGTTYDGKSETPRITQSKNRYEVEPQNESLRIDSPMAQGARPKLGRSPQNHGKSSMRQNNPYLMEQSCYTKNTNSFGDEPVDFDRAVGTPRNKSETERYVQARRRKALSQAGETVDENDNIHLLRNVFQVLEESSSERLSDCENNNTHQEFERHKDLGNVNSQHSSNQLPNTLPHPSNATGTTLTEYKPFWIDKFEKELGFVWDINMCNNMIKQHTGIWCHRRTVWSPGHDAFGDMSLLLQPPKGLPLHSKLNHKAPEFKPASQSAQSQKITMKQAASMLPSTTNVTYSRQTRPSSSDLEERLAQNPREWQNLLLLDVARREEQQSQRAPFTNEEDLQSVVVEQSTARMERTRNVTDDHHPNQQDRLVLGNNPNLSHSTNIHSNQFHLGRQMAVGPQMPLLGKSGPIRPSAQAPGTNIRFMGMGHAQNNLNIPCALPLPLMALYGNVGNQNFQGPQQDNNTRQPPAIGNPYRHQYPFYPYPLNASNAPIQQYPPMIPPIQAAQLGNASSRQIPLHTNVTSVQQAPSLTEASLTRSPSVTSLLVPSTANTSLVASSPPAISVTSDLAQSGQSSRKPDLSTQGSRQNPSQNARLVEQMLFGNQTIQEVPNGQRHSRHFQNASSQQIADRATWNADGRRGNVTNRQTCNRSSHIQRHQR